MGGLRTARLAARTLAVACLLTAAGPSACGGRAHLPADAGPDAGGDACVDCDDGVACTRDSCVDGTCAHEPDDGICESEAPCRVPACNVQAGCSGEPLPDGTWCGAPGADGAPPPVCDAGECLPQRVVGVYSWGTMRVDTPELSSEYGYYTYLARVTDRDGDGVDDVAAYVAPRSDQGIIARVAGGVRLYSFPSGETIWTLEPDIDESELGRDLASPGDLDGDGASDLAFTVERGGIQWVRAVEAAHGETLWEASADTDQLRVIGDVDADRAQDLALTTGGPGWPASLALLSARSGAELARLDDVESTVDAYFSAESMGDFDGDAIPDLAVGVELAASSSIQVVSGANLGTIATYHAVVDDWVWPGLMLPDLTDDGRAELLVVEWDGETAVDLWTGGRLWDLPFGSRTDRLTYDLDLDGRRDLIGSDWREDRHVRTWRSGATGESLFEAANSDEFGSEVMVLERAVQVPDVNDDGADDWLVPYALIKGRFLVLGSVLEVRR